MVKHGTRRFCTTGGHTVAVTVLVGDGWKKAERSQNANVQALAGLTRRAAVV